MNTIPAIRSQVICNPVEVQDVIATKDYRKISDKRRRLSPEHVPADETVVSAICKKQVRNNSYRFIYHKLWV